MGVFKNILKKNVGETEMNYESRTLKIMDLMINYLEKIYNVLGYIKNKNYKVKEDLIIQIKKILNDYNTLIDNEIVRINSNKGGIFLKGLNSKIPEQENKLNRYYLYYLNKMKLKKDINKIDLNDVKKSLNEFSTFKSRLVQYLQNNNNI